MNLRRILAAAFGPALLATFHAGAPSPAAPTPSVSAQRIGRLPARAGSGSLSSTQPYMADRQQKLSPSIVYSTYFGQGSVSAFEANAGASNIAVDPDGNLVVVGSTSSPDFPRPTPGAFQPSLRAGSCGGTPCSDLFIVKLDPTGSQVLAATYLGGSGNDIPAGLIVDGSGAIYVTGTTVSDDFPTTPNAFQRASGGGTCGGGTCADAFIAKFDATLSTLLASTLLGGSDFDCGSEIGLDAAGDVYLAGITLSPDLPVTPGVLQSSFAGGRYPGEGFVARFDPTTSTLRYLTYLGGSGTESLPGLHVARDGSVYVTGTTESADFPVTPGAVQPEGVGGRSDAFLAKINAAGSALVFSTFLGGSATDNAYDVAVGEDGSVYIVGFTASQDFPTTKRAFDRTCDGCHDTMLVSGDAFVTKVSADGSGLIYSTYLGGKEFDSASRIAIDGAGRAHVSGDTLRRGFPRKRAVHSGGDSVDGFIARFNARGSRLQFATLLGGDSSDAVGPVVLDGAGNVYVAGSTQSDDFPTTPDALQPERGVGEISFVTKIALE
jgi:hypothetical protein